MASVFDYLAQGQPSEADYLSDNPFYMGGRGIGQLQVAPTTNSEAWWMPAVQGGLSGLLQGYGKAGARQSQFSDTREMPFIKAALADESAMASNPSLAAYLSESAPESWSPKQAKADVLTSILTAQNLEEQKAKRAELAAQLQADIAKASNPEILAAKAKEAGMIEAAKAANTPVKPVEIPAAAAEKLAASGAAVNEMRSLANDIKGKTWAELKLAQNFSAADTSGIGLRVRNLTDVLGKARSGASLNATEEKAYNKMIAGDFTADPKIMASTLQKLADVETKMSLDKIDFYGGGENYKSKFTAAPTAGVSKEAAIAELKRRGKI